MTFAAHRPAALVAMLLAALIAAAMPVGAQQKAAPELIVKAPEAEEPADPVEKAVERIKALSAALKGEGDVLAAHARLWEALATLKPGAEARARIAEAAKSAELPLDYVGFLREDLPKLLAPAEAQPCGPACDDQSLLFTSRRGAYAANIVLKAPAPKPLSEAITGDDIALVATGVYTSPHGMPVGLAIVEGRVVNPVPRGWSGLILVRPDGRIVLKDMGRVEVGHVPRDLRQSLADLQVFLATAERERLTVLQSHLLIGDGELKITSRAPNKPFRRRIIFEDGEGHVAIFDSGERELSLYDAAAEVRRRYAPRLAINLDMGSYDFCRRRKIQADALVPCGTLEKPDIVSNLVVLRQKAGNP